ncbi:MAG: Ig-like domain-containing protein, partial [Proteobacteria bacterium]|nr:Ig-like domain-containing protein [Pseudomonadota bacterium]MCL2308635.1 Ig-like domain-containing protein [Pseudomonadota bacterium]
MKRSLFQVLSSAVLALGVFFATAVGAVGIMNVSEMNPAVSERYPDNPLPAATASAQALFSPTLAQSTTVWFGGYQWVVIGWNGKGVASAANEATLFLANASPNKPENTPFHDPANINDRINHYFGSDLRTAMTAFYNALPEARERNAILPRALAGNSGPFRFTLITGGSTVIDATSFNTAAGTAAANAYMRERTLHADNTFDWYAYHSLRTPAVGFIGDEQYNGTYHPDKVAGADAALNAEPLWPLSVAEVSLLDASIRVYSHWGWLRSGGRGDFNAATLYSDGFVNADGYYPQTPAALRPAFKLNLASVLFTSSSVANGKSAASVGAGLNPAAAIAATDAMKLTILDPSMVTPTLTLAGTTNGTNAIRFGYTGATTGANQVISATLIPQGGSSISHYGKLANTATNGNGSFVLSLAGVANGTYTLNVFSEQANGDTETDFASVAVSMQLVVNGGNGTINNPPNVDNDRPTISSVLPSGTGALLSGNLVITFSEAMDAATIGTVALNGTALTAAGSWSAGNTVFTIAYSGLSYGTAYTVNISGFSDAAGNEMAADNSNTFTTLAATYTAMVSPNTHTFAAATYGYGAQTAQQFTITNTGNQSLNLSASLSGGASSGFEISTGLSPTTVATPSGTATISVRPKEGLNAGAYTDTLVIRWNNDGGVGLSVNLSFTVNQATPTVIWPTASPITYGEALSASALSGGVGAGTFMWTDNTIVPSVPGGNYSVTFTPTDTTNYSTVTGAAAVMVNMATPSGTPSVTAIRQAGQTLNDANLSGVFIN